MSLFGTDQVWRVYTSHFWSVILWIFVDICGYLWIVYCWFLGLPTATLSLICLSNLRSRMPVWSICDILNDLNSICDIFLKKGTLPWDSGRLYRFKRWAQLKAVCCMNKNEQKTHFVWHMFAICNLKTVHQHQSALSKTSCFVQHLIELSQNSSFHKQAFKNIPSKTCP